VTENATTAALYRRAKIGLNLHRTSKGFGRGAPRIAHAESLNPRAYELAASGCFQISDARAEIAEVFGGAVPTFTTPDDLTRRIRGYLANPDVRDHLAAAAQRAVQGHTFAARAQQITEDLSRVHHGLRAVAV
jgi:spore maturation protein CgeB